MAETKVTSTELNPGKTTDANGWTVYDFGAFKEYVKVFPASFGGGGGSIGAQTTTAALGESSATALPVGVSNMTSVNMNYSYTASSGGDVFLLHINNWAGGSLTTLPNFYLRNTASSAVVIANAILTVTLRTV